jgi:hypothetical protein
MTLFITPKWKEQDLGVQYSERSYRSLAHTKISSPVEREDVIGRPKAPRALICCLFSPLSLSAGVFGVKIAENHSVSISTTKSIIPRIADSFREYERSKRYSFVAPCGCGIHLDEDC